MRFFILVPTLLNVNKLYLKWHYDNATAPKLRRAKVRKLVIKYILFDIINNNFSNY